MAKNQIEIDYVWLRSRTAEIILNKVHALSTSSLSILIFPIDFVSSFFIWSPMTVILEIIGLADNPVISEKVYSLRGPSLGGKQETTQT